MRKVESTGDGVSLVYELIKKPTKTWAMFTVVGEIQEEAKKRPKQASTVRVSFLLNLICNFVIF